ncbi:unnamed protein product [Caenorhabditis auriculariae]|uniref:Major facilitator superfamily (MFS) profile domain-containing protein n=1 Tax=Caenorhabditis auriculariae TaxID=2777116 RepID=A0A8S1H8D5_9PELO|nr:unnamed protein product [Caenorhabditis auriculariae]
MTLDELNSYEKPSDATRRVSIFTINGTLKDLETIAILDQRKTEWRSMWISIAMQFVVGVQISIFYMSMWPYLSGLDPTADMDFLGWVVAACNIGCTFSNPIYGWWNQRTMSVKWPTIVGFIIAAVGQAFYGMVGVLDNNVKWYMLAARIITGVGVGNLAALRAYGATASVPHDRLKAISFGTAGFVFGISFGPAIQAFFTPLGENGFKIGPIPVNMYTSAAYLMTILCLAASVFMFFFFHEDYAGIIEDKEKQDNEFMKVPKYDLGPALICIYLYMIVSMIATNIEVMSTPLSTVLFDWKDSQSVMYNGIIESITCLVSVSINLLIGFTRIGKIDKRIQIIVGLVFFLLYHLVNYPWPFYPHPLHYIPEGSNTTVVGGCLPSYEWCAHTSRVPLPVYIFAFIVFFGIAFPFVESPAAALYSEILGPRKQGTMQGLFSFGGSVSQFASPILATFLFQHSGYKYVIVTQICTLSVAFLLMAVFYRRLHPLLMKPKIFQKAVYKGGVFYAL